MSLHSLDFDASSPLEVSEALSLINDTLDAALPVLVIEGEVTEFKVNQGKFAFFNIKDKSASLSCFMMAFALKTSLEDGMKVRLVAQPRLTQWGKFSLTVREIMPVGEGSLKRAKELLKAKLEKEGLFDQSRKRRLPRIPQRVAVISSAAAAGYQDFIKILDSRWGGVSLMVADVVVQGAESPRQIERAISYINEMGSPPEVIVIVRGGGSVDDLSSFDNEAVVRAVAGSRIPTLIGVGHEKDVSLADLAADIRASTPSNAAEILVPDKRDILDRVKATVRTAENGVNTAIKVFGLDSQELLSRIEIEEKRLISQKTELLGRVNQTLRQLDPQRVIRRGYSLVKADSGEYITKTSDVTMGDRLSLQVSDGVIKAEVL